MFRVVIVDDEPIIRKGLKNIINWKQFDCEVCGEACDGTEGYELIKSVQPDIIFTDIRMPGTDGLTMIRNIKEAVSDCKVIILTGYRDFDYVHEAIRLGAFDFILKPSKIEELTAVVKRAVKELRFQKGKAEEFDKLKKLFEQNIPVLREKLLYDVIHEINTDIGEIQAKMELFNVKIDSFVLVVVESENVEAGNEINQYEKHLYQFGIMNTFEEIFSDIFGVLCISLNNSLIAFAVQLPQTDSDDYVDKINDKCMHLQEIIQNCFGFTITVTVSSCGAGPMELPSKLKECYDALERKFYIGNNSIISYKDMDMFFKYEDDMALDKHEKELLKSIKSGNEKLVSSILLDVFNSVNETGSANKEAVKNFYWTIISAVNNIKTAIPEGDDNKYTHSKDLSSLYKMIQRCDNVKELNDILEEVSLKTASKINSFNNKSMKLVLRKALDYIHEHYSEQITLNGVEDNAYVSIYYMSRIFKRELGKNFIDYLNEVRLEKAKELLAQVKYKTYEIAEMVGIPDAHYFSRLFKKYEGLTPTEYRDSRVETH